MSNLSTTVIDAIQDKKGRRITEIDLSPIESAPASGFVICEGNSTSQVSAIADNIREEVYRQKGLKPYNYDGYRNSQWIVIDYGTLMVHIFLPDGAMLESRIFRISTDTNRIKPLKQRPNEHHAT